MSLNKEIKQKINSARHTAVLNIVYTANMLDKISRKFFGRFDITQAQYNVMIIIKLENRSLTQVEISERMVSSRANITSLLDKLQKKGYICRIPVAGDRRVYKVQLTHKGLRKIQDIEPEYVNAIEKSMKNISAEESRVLSSLLVELRKSFRKSMGDNPEDRDSYEK